MLELEYLILFFFASILPINNRFYGILVFLLLHKCTLCYSIKIQSSTVQYLSFVLSTTLYIFLNNQHILSIMLTILWMRQSSKKPSLDSPTINQMSKVSYQSLHNGTDGFSNSNLIGSGNFSSVYKGTFELEDKVVAIKVLNLRIKRNSQEFHC